MAKMVFGEWRGEVDNKRQAEHFDTGRDSTGVRRSACGIKLNFAKHVSSTEPRMVTCQRCLPKLPKEGRPLIEVLADE